MTNTQLLLLILNYGAGGAVVTPEVADTYHDLLGVEGYAARLRGQRSYVPLDGSEGHSATFDGDL